MSVEQWGALALFVVLPLVEIVLRMRRARAGHGANGGEVRTLNRGLPPPHRAADDAAPPATTQVTSSPRSFPPPLPQRVPPPAIPLSRRRSASNLRRAIVVATILGPPTSGTWNGGQ